MKRSLSRLFLMVICGLAMLSMSAHALSPKTEVEAVTPSRFAQIRELGTQGGQVTSIDHIDFKFIVGDLDELLEKMNQRQRNSKKKLWKQEDMLDLLESLAKSRQPLPASELDTFLTRDQLGKETTNPSIIKNMIASKDPGEQAIIRAVIAKMAREGKDAQAIVERFTSVLVQLAAKKFHPGFVESQGQYNIVSIEVSPMEEPLDRFDASVTEAYLKQALQYARISENNDVKAGMTPSGISTLLQLTSRGVKVNSTLMFPDAQINENGELDAPQYVAVAEAYIYGLEVLRSHTALGLDKGLPEKEREQIVRKTLASVVSVDSEFMSRGGVLVHGKREGALKAGGQEFTIDNAYFAEKKMALEVAQAKLIYQIQQKIYNPDYQQPQGIQFTFTRKIEELAERFQRLQPLGANPKRLFLASTGTKGEHKEFMQSVYGDAWEYAYVQELIADGSMATHPPATYKKFNEAGDGSRLTIENNLATALEVVKHVSKNYPGLIDAVSRELLGKGVEQFIKDHKSTLDLVERVILETRQAQRTDGQTGQVLAPAA